MSGYMNTDAVSVEMERMVAGSLTTRQGDTIMAFTDGVSGVAEDLCAIMAQGNSASHASLYAWIHPDTMRATMIHVQGQHTVYSQQRAYDTRAVYECMPNDLRRMGGYSSMVKAIDGMRHYDECQYAINPIVTVNPKPLQPLTEDEQILLDTLQMVIEHDTRMMLRIGDDECLYASDLLKSQRLLSILRVFDCLSDNILPLASLAYAVEHSCYGMQMLWPYMRVVAHFDDVETWGDEVNDACIMDWTTPKLRNVNYR